MLLIKKGLIFIKLKPNYIVHHLEDESMLVPLDSTDFYGVVNGSKTFGFILECLKQDTTEAEIIERIKEKYTDISGDFESDVSRVIADLRSLGAIVD